MNRAIIVLVMIIEVIGSCYIVASICLNAIIATYIVSRIIWSSWYMLKISVNSNVENIAVKYNVYYFTLGLKIMLFYGEYNCIKFLQKIENEKTT